jgi:flagellar secretion chaperone FliS
MYQTAYNAYRASAVNTVEDSRMVLIKLFDGAIKFLIAAKRGIEVGSSKIRGENISKAMAIITELHCALDMESGGPLAVNLESLYKYVMEQLTLGNIKNDSETLTRAENILATLMDGFEGAIQQQKLAVKATLHPPEMEARVRMERVSYAV